MRPALLCAAVLCAGCFGQPEDQFSIEGTVHRGDGGLWPGAKVKLERDQGATDLACSAFSDFTTATADEDGAWRVDVIRQQTRGRLSERRCFRASVAHEDGRRSQVVWPFTGEDVHVPPLRIWGDRNPSGASSAGLFFFTLPDSFKLAGDGASGLSYRAEVFTPAGRLWRAGCAGSPSRQFCDADFRSLIGTQFPFIRASATQTSEHFGRDPFGQLKVTAFESRIETRPVTVNTFGAQPPFTLGADCAFKNSAGACALTDGDPTPQLLPLGTFQIEVDFGTPIAFGPLKTLQLYLHGLWVDGAWTGVVVEASLEDTAQYQQVALFPVDKDNLARIQVSRDDPLPGLDLGPIPVPGGVFAYRKLRIHAVNNLQTVPFTSAGEVSVY